MNEDSNVDQDSIESKPSSNISKLRKFSNPLKSASEYTVMDALIQNVIEEESGVSNVIASSSISKDVETYLQQLEEQFVAFKSFVAGTNPTSYRQELVALKYPLFVNIYLELVLKLQEKKSMLFYSQHVGDFFNEHRDELQHLRGITVPEKLSTSDIAAKFRKSKFVYKLSHKAFIYLLQFLSTQSRIMLLRFFEKHIHLDVDNVRTSLWENLKSGKMKHVFETTQQSDYEDTPTELLRTIKAMKDEPPNAPHVILHHLENCHQR